MDLQKEFNWKRFTINIVLGYIISWLYFFLALPFFTLLFGKVQGATINYLISWIIWFVAYNALNKLYPKGNNTLKLN